MSPAVCVAEQAGQRQVHRAAPEMLGVVETFVGAAPVQQMLGAFSGNQTPLALNQYDSVTRDFGQLDLWFCLSAITGIAGKHLFAYMFRSSRLSAPAVFVLRSHLTPWLMKTRTGGDDQCFFMNSKLRRCMASLNVKPEIFP